MFVVSSRAFEMSLSRGVSAKGEEGGGVGNGAGVRHTS
jgi:hypothetical protein